MAFAHSGQSVGTLARPAFCRFPRPASGPFGGAPRGCGPPGLFCEHAVGEGGFAPVSTAGNDGPPLAPPACFGAIATASASADTTTSLKFGPPPPSLVKWGPTTLLPRSHPVCGNPTSSPFPAALAAIKLSALDMLLAPRRWVVDSAQAAAQALKAPARITPTSCVHEQRASTKPATREDAVALARALDAALETARGPDRRRVVAECLDELIRQTATACAERGALLARVRDEHAKEISEMEKADWSEMFAQNIKIAAAEQRAAELPAQLEASTMLLVAAKRERDDYAARVAAQERAAADTLARAEQRHRAEVAIIERRVRETERAVVVAVLAGEVTPPAA
jgi:hypothetical protein